MTIATISDSLATDQEETARLARRRDIRHEIAAVEILERRRDELQKQIGEIDAKADRAADKHRDATTPIQARLAELDASILTALANREPVHTGDEAERQTLLQQIATENEALEGAVQLCDKLASPLRKELDKLRLTLAEKPQWRDRLLEEGVAHPGLYGEFLDAGSELDWARRRYSAARSSLEQTRDRLGFAKERRDVREIAGYSKLLCRWEREESAASAALQAASEKLTTIREQIIAE